MSVIIVESESHLPPWERTHNGLTWRDMGGMDSDLQKLNHALFRRGLYNPSVEIVQGDEAEALLREVPEGRRAAGGGVLVRKARRTGAGSIQAGVVTGKTRGKKPVREIRAERCRELDAQEEAWEALRREIRAWCALGEGRTPNFIGECSDGQVLRGIMHRIVGEDNAGRRVKPETLVNVRTALARAKVAFKNRLRQQQRLDARRAAAAAGLQAAIQQPSWTCYTTIAKSWGVGPAALYRLLQGQGVMVPTLERIEHGLKRDFGALLPRTAGRPGTDHDVPVAQVKTKRPAEQITEPKGARRR
jgi:hypothetical protein